MESSLFSKVVVLLGRVCFSAIFLLAGLGHFNANSIAYAANRGVPMANILVPVAGAMALAGGLSVLIGYRARFGAWLLILFLAPVTFMMHKYWAVPDPKAAMVEHVMFMKNIALLGGALLISHFGSGPWSVSRK